MKSDVLKVFDDTIKSIFKSKPDIIRMLLDHETKPKCIDELCYQIKLAELGSVKIDVIKYKLMITEIAKLFANAALEKKKQELLSDNERKRLIKDSDHIKEANEIVSDLNKEEIEDLKPKIYMGG